MFNIICSAVSAVLLFFYAIHRFSKIISRCNIHTLKRFFEKIVHNPLKSMFVGVGATGLMQSNKAVSAIVLTIVNAGAIATLSSIPILFSTQIGASSTAFLVSIKFQSMEEVLIIFGAILKKTKYKNVGHIVFYLGLLLLSLEMMSTATSSLQNEAWFRNIFTITNNVFILFMIGLILSFILQVSALFTCLMTILVDCSALSMHNAVAISNGVAVGSAMSLLIVTASMNKDAKKACYIYIIFMLVVSLLWLPFTNLFSNIGVFVGNNGFGYAISNLVMRATICISGVVLFYFVYYNKIVGGFISYCLKKIKTLSYKNRENFETNIK